jgi:hypothetical protein
VDLLYDRLTENSTSCITGHPGHESEGSDVDESGSNHRICLVEVDYVQDNPALLGHDTVTPYT